MPVITLHLDALEHNHRLLSSLACRWGFHLMPVLKMVACHPAVTRWLYEAGYEAFGAADVDEPTLFGPQPKGRKVLINIPPLARVADVVRNFDRSPVSSLEGIAALDAAAGALGVMHDALIMADLGDLREGVPVLETAALADQIRRAHFRHVRVAGLGVNMGCLSGACPDETNMALLAQTIRDVEAALGHPLDVISLGGSIFLDWFSLHGADFRAAFGNTVEFRAGDPLLLGYDMYRNQDFPGGHFRTDVFRFSATVVELREKDIQPPRQCVLNGQGHEAHLHDQGLRKRAILDCGVLHTDMEALKLDLPGAEIVDFNGNYTILDVTECLTPLKLGDDVAFHPHYWAVARAFRMPLVSKRIVPVA